MGSEVLLLEVDMKQLMVFYWLPIIVGRRGCSSQGWIFLYCKYGGYSLLKNGAAMQFLGFFFMVNKLSVFAIFWWEEVLPFLRTYNFYSWFERLYAKNLLEVTIVLWFLYFLFSFTLSFLLGSCICSGMNILEECDVRKDLGGFLPLTSSRYLYLFKKLKRWFTWEIMLWYLMCKQKKWWELGPCSSPYFSNIP